MQSKDNPGSTSSTGFNPFLKIELENELYPTRDAENNRLPATDLFSLFTADIIKQEKEFTR